jgi:hypothetical protein
MTARRVTQIRTVAQRKAAKMASISDGQLICLSMHRHDFPSDTLSPRDTKLPKGMEARLERQGSYQITDTCRRCGKKRTFDTPTGDLFGQRAGYKYERPDDHVVFSRDECEELGISPSADAAVERFHRIAPLIQRTAQPVTEVKFKGAGAS